MSSESPFNNKLEFTPTLETQQSKKYWRYKMSKLRQTLIFVVAVILLLTAVSCGKKSTEPEDDIPDFQDWGQFWNYVDSFDWVIGIWCEKVGNNLLVWLDLESEPDLSIDDTFSLVVNDQTVPVEVYDDDGDIEIAINNDNDIVLPNSAYLKIQFSYNNAVIVNTSIRVPSFPSLQNLPEPIDWTRPLTLKWSLTPNKNNHIQGIWAYAENDDDEDYYSEYNKMIAVSARQHTIPANTISVNDISYYELVVGEMNLKKYGNCLLMAICSDYASNDDDEYSRSNERIEERMQKMRF
jgi:hypothetical protein